MSSDTEEYAEQGDVSSQSRNLNVARRAVRFVLANTESQNTIISRARLQNAIRDAAVEEHSQKSNFFQVYQDINAILGDVFGYELRGILSRNANSSGGIAMDESEGSKAQSFILLNKMRYIAGFEEFKVAQQSQSFNDMIINGAYIGAEMDTPSNFTLKNKLSTDQDMVFKGILSVVLCIVLFSKNNILHQELLKGLGKFGIPTDGSHINILNYSIDDLLKILERKEYISKLEEKSDIEGDVVMYRVGRRTKAEFDLDALVNLVRTLLGLPEDQLPDLKGDIAKSIGDSYATKSS